LPTLHRAEDTEKNVLRGRDKAERSIFPATQRGSAGFRNRGPAVSDAEIVETISRAAMTRGGSHLLSRDLNEGEPELYSAFRWPSLAGERADTGAESHAIARSGVPGRDQMRKGSSRAMGDRTLLAWPSDLIAEGRRFTCDSAK